jgi:stage III sporulation protein AA
VNDVAVASKQPLATSTLLHSHARLSHATLTATLEMSAVSATLARHRVAPAASAASAARDASFRGRVVAHISGVPPARGRASRSRPPRAPSRAPSSLSAYADDRRVLGDVSATSQTTSESATSSARRAADVPGADAFAAHLASLTDPGELDKLVALLPPRLRDALREHPRRLALLEVVLDLGRAPIARFADGDEQLVSDPLTYDDVDAALAGVGDVGGDNRAGVNETLHRVSVIRNRAGNVVGLTARVGRAIEGSADLVLDLLRSGRSVLLLGRPGVGKTTAIREIARVLSVSRESGGMARRVVIVDTSNEIGGDGDIPHPGIGAARRMQVPRPDSQHHVLIEAVQNHTPEVIVVDEIGTELEAQAARTISQRGVQMIATAHGHTLENLLKNPTLNDLVGGVASVTLGDDEARRRRVQKSVLEREGPPTFGAAVEMLEIGRWRVHLDVGVAVDTLLAGYEPHVEIRSFDERTGEVIARPWLGDGVGAEDSSGLFGSGGWGSVTGPFGFGGGGNLARGEQGAVAVASPAFQSYDRILGGWGDTGAGPPPGASSGIVRSKAGKAAEESSSGLAAREVSEAAARRASAAGASRSGDTGLDAPGARSSSDASSLDAFEDSRVFRVYPHELDCDVVEEVIESLGLSEMCVLTSVLEEASAVLAVKARVKGATWLRHAARARGMPIYALKAEGIPQLARAIQAMLGLNAHSALAESSGASAAAKGPAGVRTPAGTLGVSSLEGAGAERDGLEGDLPSFGPNVSSSAGGGGARPRPIPAEETDALDEVRMAVEQLVIPHQEPVELLPRDARLLAMQKELIEREYRLEHEECGEGNARRIRILHTYVKSA